MKTLPEQITELESLQTLNLWYNRLEELPESLGNLKSLNVLNLGSNQLSTLPDSIGNLKHLHTLVLTHNKLRTIPDTIKNLNSLRNLYVERNLFPHKYDREEILPKVVKDIEIKGVRVHKIAPIDGKKAFTLYKNTKIKTKINPT